MLAPSLDRPFVAESDIDDAWLIFVSVEQGQHCPGGIPRVNPIAPARPRKNNRLPGRGTMHHLEDRAHCLAHSCVPFPRAEDAAQASRCYRETREFAKPQRETLGA